MGSRVRVEDSRKNELGVFPRPFDQTIRSKKFLRSVKDEALASFLRRAEWGREGWASGEMMLRALDAVETEVRARVAKRPDDVEHADMLIMETTTGKEIWHALVRTGFDETGIAWERYTPESKDPVFPYDGKWPWALLGMDDPKPEVMRQLGPIEVPSDGAIVVAMHVENEDRRGTRYTKREMKGRLRFVRPWEHPKWLALRASVAEHPHEQFCWTDW